MLHFEPSRGKAPRIWAVRRQRASLNFNLAGRDNDLDSEGGMVQLETPIELNFLNSSLSSSNF